MTVRVWVVGLTLLAAAVAASSAAQPEGASKEPFYRKYLVPGNKLDDRILEQEQRIADSPNDASLHNDMGNLLAARRFAREAAEQYELAAKLDKANFVALYNLGLLRETEGKFSEAISAYKKAIDRKHGFPPAHFRLGRLYEKSERNPEAVAEYATAMRIDPSMRNPRRNPLVIDSTLIYQASIANYPLDIATASMSKETVYVEESRFRTVPVDRPVSSQEAAGVDEEAVAEPRQIGVSDAAGSATSETAPGTAGRHPAVRPTPRSPQAQRPRPVPRGGTPLVAAPPGATVLPPPPPAEAVPPPAEPESPPESMPEPTPAAPVEEEPS
jgi:Tetratricopeptide repeat